MKLTFCSRRFSTGIALILLALPISGFANEPKNEVNDYQRQLERLFKSIDKVKQHLKSTHTKRGNALTELHQVEAEISKNSLKLQKTGKKIRMLDKRISNLKQDLRKLENALVKQKNALAEQVRSGYALGGQQQLKMLLNQQDTSSIGRLHVYLDYLNRARQHQIETFTQTIHAKQSLETEVKQSLQQQTANLAKQKAQKKQLNKQRRQRNKLLATLDIEIKNQETTLSNLEDSRNRIENLLMSLGELLADIPPSPGDLASFASLKGDLPWPVDGRFIARYGVAKNQGDLKWKGVLIDSEYGVPVKVVSHGRVAFSDWLQGFGFITIVDHGDGYMTLYGHNESLFKQPGDWVTAGEVIATVGDSGGHTRPSLYFEVRERGKPVDPDDWCTDKPGQKG